MPFHHLRTYQAKAIEEVIRRLSNGVVRLILVGPTGSGKTATLTALLEQLLTARPTMRVLVTCHRSTLLRQLGESLPRERVTLQTAQSLNARAIPVLGPGDLIVVDEAHRADANFVLDANPNTPRLGLTATPYRRDGNRIVPLHPLYDEMVVMATPRELLDQGFLSPLRLYGPPLPPGAAEAIRRRRVEGFEEVMDSVMQRADVCGSVVDTWVKAGPAQTILFAPQVKTAKEMAQQFREAGIKAEFLHGGDPESRRDRVMGDFAEGRTTVICNADLLTEGIDLPMTQRIVLMRPTISPIVFLQQVGRGTRTFPGKTHCDVFDHVGNIIYHGHPYADRVTSMDPAIPYIGSPDIKELKTYRCGSCFAVFYARAVKCPYCDKVIPERKRDTTLRVNSNGKIVEYDPKREAELQATAQANADARGINNSRIRQLFSHYAKLGMNPSESRALVMQAFGIFQSDQRRPPDKRKYKDWDEYLRSRQTR